MMEDVQKDIRKLCQILTELGHESFTTKKNQELMAVLGIQVDIESTNSQGIQKYICMAILNHYKLYRQRLQGYVDELVGKQTSPQIKSFLKNVLNYFHNYKNQQAQQFQNMFTQLRREPIMQYPYMGMPIPTISSMSSMPPMPSMSSMPSMDPYQNIESMYRRVIEQQHGYMPHLMYSFNNFLAFYPGGFPSPLNMYPKEFQNQMQKHLQPQQMRMPDTINYPTDNKPLGVSDQCYQQMIGRCMPNSSYLTNTYPINNLVIQSPSESYASKNQNQNQTNTKLDLPINTINNNSTGNANSNSGDKTTNRKAWPNIQPNSIDPFQIKRVSRNPKEKQQHPPSLSTRRSSPNLLKQVNKEYVTCLCTGKLTENDGFSCKQCQHKYHYTCMKIKKSLIDQNDQSICPFCKMKQLDPLSQVQKTILEEFVIDIADKKFESVMDLKNYAESSSHKDNVVQIELRCVRINSTDINDITWPDQCVMKLNSQKIIEFPALQQHSSLKKRKDFVLHIGKSIFQFMSKDQLQKVRISMEIMQLKKDEPCVRKINNNFNFAFGVYLVKKLSVQELYSQIMNNKNSIQNDDFINKALNTNEADVEIEQITVSLYDPYTKDIMKTPARGSKCAHGQCFDLKVFLSFMSIPKNSIWKCPICSRQCREFKIDKQQSAILEEMKNYKKISSEVTFAKNGKVIFKVEEEQQDDDVAPTKSMKTKKIEKQPKVTAKIEDSEEG